MEHFSSNLEQGPAKINPDDIIAFAAELPPQSPEVKEMLLKWMEQTTVPEGQETIKYLDVAVIHAVMQYKLGFLSANEALDTLETIRIGVIAELGEDSEMHYDISDIMYAIEDQKDWELWGSIIIKRIH